MKKLITFIFLFFTFTNVSAKTYYFNYSEYSDYQLDLVEENDEVIVEKDITNHYYKNEYIYSENYYLENENPIQFPYKSDDFILVSQENLLEKPKNTLNRVITESTRKVFADVLPVRYIKLSNIENLTYIGVKNSKGTIDYSISYGDVYVIDLNDYYQIDDITIIIKADEIKIEILRELDEVVYYSKTFKKIPSQIRFNLLSVINPEYSEEYYNEDDIPRYKSSQIRYKTTYKYVDKLFKYYYINKIYNPSYFYSDEYNLAGEEITLYRYRTRDKLEVMDNIVINDENNIRLDDIVLYSSVPYKVFSNLDLSINGEYNVTILTDFKEINTKILVDKKSNLVNALIKEMELNNELKNEVNNLNSIVNDQYMNIKEIINITNDQVNEINNKLLIEKEKNRQIVNDKSEIKDVIVEKKVNKQVFLPICFIIIFLISMYFYLKKSITKNS